MELKALTKGLSRFFTGLWPRPQLPPRYSDGWQAGTPLDATRTSSALGFSALRRGLEIVTGQLVSTPLLVFDGTTELPDSPQANILANTDPADFETALSDMVTTGNGWLQLVDDHLECIQAFRVSALIDSNGQVHYFVDSGIELDMARTVHLQCRNYYSPFLGDSLLEAYSESAASMMMTLSIFRQIQSNGSFAEVIISTEMPLTSTQMKELRSKYDEMTAAAQGAIGGTVIMGGGMKPYVIRKVPTALDQDIVASLNFTVEEAARMTGVPLSMLSTRDTGAAYNSSVEQNRAFYRATMRPLFYRVEKELSRVLGTSIQYDVQELLLGTGLERAEVLSKLLQVGVMSIDEARESLAYGTIPGGDVHMMPLNSVPLAEWLKPKPTETGNVAG